MFDTEKIDSAYRTLYCRAILDGETEGSRTMTALTKAVEELERNSTIIFDGVKVSFVSRASGKTRIVTKDGCVQCPCENRMSYHQALFALCAEAGKPTTQEQLIKAGELNARADMLIEKQAAFDCDVKTYLGKEQTDAPYIQARLNNHKREVCGGIRF